MLIQGRYAVEPVLRQWKTTSIAILINEVVSTNTRLMEKYLPAIVAVNNGKSSPLGALEKAEEEYPI